MKLGIHMTQEHIYSVPRQATSCQHGDNEEENFCIIQVFFFTLNTSVQVRMRCDSYTTQFSRHIMHCCHRFYGIVTV